MFRSVRTLFPRLQSRYVPMPDGARLAVDVWLPSGTTAGARLPTVLETDRYWRAAAYTGGMRQNPNYDRALPWNRRGYAYLTVTGLHGASDGALYAYLEDVQPDGRVVYITEGQLSLADRTAAPRRDNPPWRRLRTPRSYASADAAPFPLDQPEQVTFDPAADLRALPGRGPDPDHDRGRRPGRVPVAARERQGRLPDRPRRHGPVLRGTARGRVSAAGQAFGSGPGSSPRARAASRPR